MQAQATAISTPLGGGAEHRGPGVRRVVTPKNCHRLAKLGKGEDAWKEYSFEFGVILGSESPEIRETLKVLASYMQKVTKRGSPSLSNHHEQSSPNGSDLHGVVPHADGGATRAKVHQFRPEPAARQRDVRAQGGCPHRLAEWRRQCVSIPFCGFLATQDIAQVVLHATWLDNGQSIDFLSDWCACVRGLLADDRTTCRNHIYST